MRPSGQRENRLSWGPGDDAATPTHRGPGKPSASRVRWQNDRMPRLGEVDAQRAASLALTPAQPNLVEENLRGYVLLLSAHFQGFCRDLYTESANIIVSRVRPRLRLLIQASSRPTGGWTTATRIFRT